LAQDHRKAMLGQSLLRTVLADQLSDLDISETMALIPVADRDHLALRGSAGDVALALVQHLEQTFGGWKMPLSI
jgi:hypothetical protein